MKAEHTATPWEINADEFIINVVGANPNGDITTIANCMQHLFPQVDVANANHIVHCVNSHDAFVDALEKLTYYTEMIDDYAPFSEIVDLAKQTLALAKGE